MQSLRRPLRFYVFYVAVIEFRAFLALPLTTGAGYDGAAGAGPRPDNRRGHDTPPSSQGGAP